MLIPPSGFPLRKLQERIPLLAAQKPAQDRVDAGLPPHAQEGRHGGGREEALAADCEAPARDRRRGPRHHRGAAEPDECGPCAAAVGGDYEGEDGEEGEGGEEG